LVRRFAIAGILTGLTQSVKPRAFCWEFLCLSASRRIVSASDEDTSGAENGRVFFLSVMMFC
jgi:hypothetical protein